MHEASFFAQEFKNHLPIIQTMLLFFDWLSQTDLQETDVSHTLS